MSKLLQVKSVIQNRVEAKVEKPELAFPRWWHPKDKNEEQFYLNTKLADKIAKKLSFFVKNNTLEEIKDNGDSAFLVKNPKLVHSPDHGLVNEIGLIYKIDNKWELDYYLNYILFKWNNLNCLTQTKVWSGGLYKVTSKVFFDYLLPQCDAVMSDSWQSIHGGRMWENNLIPSAIRQGYYVYFIDLESNNIKQLEKLQDIRLIIKKESPWGDDPEFEKRRFLVSKIKIKTS